MHNNNNNSNNTLKTVYTHTHIYSRTCVIYIRQQSTRSSSSRLYCLYKRDELATPIHLESSPAFKKDPLEEEEEKIYR